MAKRWLEGIRTAVDIPTAQRCYEHLASLYGFNAHSYVDLPHSSTMTNILDQDAPLPFFTSTLHQAFIDDYNGARFLSCDPILRHARICTQPFTWYHCPELRKARDYRGGRKSKARQVLELAYDYGFVDGCIMPVHGIDCHGNRRSSFVSLYWSDQPRPDFSIGDLLPYLHLGTMMYHETMLNLRPRPASHVPQADPDADISLGDRERACLTLAARGQKTAEMAYTLSISEHSASSYIKSARRRLMAKTTAEAVAKALDHGLIAC